MQRVVTARERQQALGLAALGIGRRRWPPPRWATPRSAGSSARSGWPRSAPRSCGGRPTSSQRQRWAAGARSGRRRRRPDGAAAGGGRRAVRRDRDRGVPARQPGPRPGPVRAAGGARHAGRGRACSPCRGGCGWCATCGEERRERIRERRARRDRRAPARLGAADPGADPAPVRPAARGAAGWPAARSASCGTWLYGPDRVRPAVRGRRRRRRGAGALAEAVAAAAAEVEDTYAVDGAAGAWSATPAGRAACARWSRPAGRRWSTRPSTPRSARSACTPRSSRTTVHVFVRDRGVGFDPDRRCPTTGTGWPTRCAAGWNATAGRSSCAAAAGEGTEVQLEMPRAVVAQAAKRPARRPAATRRETHDEPSRSGCSWSTTMRCSAPGCGPSWTAGVPDVTVVGEAGSVGEAVAGIRHLQPDVVLLDVHMPDGGGAEVLRQVRTELPDVVFLALSVSDAAEDVIAVIRAGRPRLRHQDDLRAGAGRRGAPGPGRRRGVLAAAGRFRARRVLRPPGRGAAGRPRAGPADPAGARRAAAAGPRLRLQGDRRASCSSRSRRSRRTCRACCARPSCPTATSCPAGPPTDDSSEVGAAGRLAQPADRAQQAADGPDRAVADVGDRVDRRRSPPRRCAARRAPRGVLRRPRPGVPQTAEHRWIRRASGRYRRSQESTRPPRQRGRERQ